jgi:predicted NAD-dependent protein-ADP-ribosyltransferase YbiA (DUF1768 family)
MRAIFKHGLLALAAESQAERAECARLMEAGDHVFALHAKTDHGFSLVDLGPAEFARREPINIVWTNMDERWRAISNLAPTSFDLHGRSYASVEGFWQGLKFRGEGDRARIAALSGMEARAAGRGAPQPARFRYEGQEIEAGRPEHWALMAAACAAKFEPEGEARHALLATAERPLTHRVRDDSRTIPGAIMAEIWMSLRERLRRAEA